MIANTIEIQTLVIPNAPALDGLKFRRFLGPSDYPKMLAVIQESKGPDQIERNDTLEDIQRTYSHLNHSDINRDMFIVEIHDRVVGYGRVEWNINADNEWIGLNLGFLLPEWRRKGIGGAMLRYNESRLRQIGIDLQDTGVIYRDQPKFSEVFAYDTEYAKLALLNQEGYLPVRHEQFMVRPDLENIPEAPMPSGLEGRDVLPEHYRAIWDAGSEAFRDHWGYVAPSEEDYRNWLEDRNFNPSLWRVAWDGDQVAGMVQSYINHDENREYNRLRGWTEGICVRRPWRRMGLARALLVQSLHVLKEQGMHEAALTVDTQNLSGAFRLYESVGFRPVKHLSVYRKSLS